MANPVLASLVAQIKRNTDTEKSAALLISGFKQRLQDAKAEALKNGATEEELAPIQGEIDLLVGSETELAQAVAANTTP